MSREEWIAHGFLPAFWDKGYANEVFQFKPFSAYKPIVPCDYIIRAYIGGLDVICGYYQTMALYDTIAIRIKDWDSVKDEYLRDGWQFRNQVHPAKDELDNGARFWSATGEPADISSVVYIRKPKK